MEILMGFGAMFGILILCAIGILAFYNLALVSDKGNSEEKLLSASQPPKKALVVYQPSVSDVTQKTAMQIAKGLNEGGYEVILNHPGKHLNRDVSGYSVIVLGSPTYMGKTSAVLSTFISEMKNGSSKKIVLFSTGQDANEDELGVMESSLKDTKAFKKIKFQVKDKDKENTNQLAYDLGKELSKE